MRIGVAGPIKVSSLKHHLVNLTNYDENLGLGGTAINEIIDGFIKKGHHVTVFTLDPSITEKYVLEGPNVKIIFGNFRVNSKIKYIDFCQKEFTQIKKFIQEEENNIDIVNAHWSYEFAIGTILAKTPHLITFRDYAPKVLKFQKHIYRFFRLLMDIWVRKNGKNFSFNSNYLKDVINVNGVVIPNSFKEENIKEHKISPVLKKKIKICCISNGWGKLKNPKAALKAFCILKKKINNIELHLFGKGYESKGENFEKMEKEGLNNHVFYRGEFSHNKLMQELAESDILLHTSKEESFGNILIEAMANGVPVIAGENSGAVPWVLDYGKAGCLVDIENPQEIADKLELLITNKKKYEEYSVNGINNLKNRFTQKIVCQEYINEYERIINESSTYI